MAVKKISLQLNKVYQLSLDIDSLCSVFGISKDEVKKADGRPWSYWLECFVNSHFSGVSASPHSGTSDYDHILPSGRKADSKLLTTNGVSIAPSMNIGDKGLAKTIRENQGEQAGKDHQAKKRMALENKAKEQVYIIVDITSIQEGRGDYLRILAIEGVDLAFPKKGQTAAVAGKNGNISVKKAYALFEEYQ